jgi:FAD/FMN-containing dehydrogenase
MKTKNTIVEFLHNNHFDYSLDKDTLGHHSKDASIFMVIPEVVVYPRNKMEVKKLLSEINSSKSAGQDISISVRAGGTCMSGGSLNTSVILNMTKYMNSFSVNPEDKTVDVEMGVMYRDLEKEMDKNGLFFAGYTSSKDICGIGGMIGNNASGEKSILYGSTIENVLSTTVIFPNGEECTFQELSEADFDKKTLEDTYEGYIYKGLKDILNNSKDEIKSIMRPVPKSASGYRIDKIYDPVNKTYNLSRLFVGSQSTLGVIVKVKLHLHKSLPERQLMAIPVKALENLPTLLKTIMMYRPESVETFDINTLNSASKFKPKDADVVYKYMGKDSELIILVEFSSENREDVETKSRSLLQQIEGHNNAYMIEDHSEYQSIWAIRRSSFGVMRDDVTGNNHAVPCIEDIIVPIDKFDIFVPNLINILKSRNIHYGFHGHIGDGSLRVIPIFDFSDKNVVDKIVDLSRSVFSLIKKLEGNMSADHSDGIIRSPFLKEFYGSKVMKMFKDVKNIFDPNNICNPGKKTDSDISMISEHIIKS